MPRHGCTTDSQLGPPQGAPPEESGPGRGGCGSSPDQDRSQAELGSAQSERDPARREAAVMAITKRAYLPFCSAGCSQHPRQTPNRAHTGLLHAARAFQIIDFPYSSPRAGASPLGAVSSRGRILLWHPRLGPLPDGTEKTAAQRHFTRRASSDRDSRRRFFSKS